MIQLSLGYDDLDPSISKAAGANRDRFPGAVVHQKGALMEREEEEAIEIGQGESDTACS